MKINFLVLALVVFSFKAGFACAPPPNVFSVQGGEIPFVLGSDDVRKVILESGDPSLPPYQKGVRNISYNYKQATYTIETLRDCSFDVAVNYKVPEHNGMCATKSGVTISNLVCK